MLDKIIPAEFFRIIVVFILSVPLSYAHGLIPAPYHRHLFNLAVSLALGWYVLQWDFMYPFILMLITWCCITFLPLQHQVKTVATICTIYISAIHFGRLFGDHSVYRLEHSAASMMTAIRAVMTAFNVQDGKKDASKVPPEALPDRVAVAPSLLEYSSFILHYPSFHTGPIIPYNTFIRNFQRSVKQRQTLEKGIQKAMALRCVVLVFCIIMYVVGGKFPWQATATPAFAALSGGLVARLIYAWFATLAVRFRYYTLWSFVDVSYIACGLNAGTHPPADGLAIGPAFQIADDELRAKRPPPRSGVTLYERLITWIAATAIPLPVAAKDRLSPQATTQTAAGKLPFLPSDRSVGAAGGGGVGGEEVGDGASPVPGGEAAGVGVCTATPTKSRPLPNRFELSSSPVTPHGNSLKLVSGGRGLMAPLGPLAHLPPPVLQAVQRFGVWVYESYFGPDAMGVKESGAVHDACANIDICAVELASTIRMAVDWWNAWTSRFFRVYVYARLNEATGGKYASAMVLATELTSAAWHGLFLGYYLFFGFAAVYMVASRFFREKVRPFVILQAQTRPEIKIAYDVAEASLNHLIAAYLMLFFIHLYWTPGWAAVSNVAYLPVIVVVTTFTVGWLLPQPPAEVRRKARELQHPSH